jgi:hypothetical protein
VIDVLPARLITSPAQRRTATSALRVLAAMLLALGLAAPARGESSAWRMGDYSIGNGLTLPHGLWIAGDVTLHGQVPEHGPSTVELDDLSFLARWEATTRLTLFAELRMENFFEAVAGEGVTPSQWQFVFERLYAEVLVTPAFTLRLGTVYTPFGLWNVVRRSPFTWTVEEPAISDDVFPNHSTGLSLLYQTTWRGWSFDATAYGPIQDAARWGHPSDDDEHGLVTGTRVAVGRALGPAFGSLGLNAAGFRDRGRSTWGTVIGLDSELDLRGNQVTGELTWRFPGSGQRGVHGLYLQDAIALEPLVASARDLYGVVRFEYFQPGTGAAEIGGVLGLFWRPVPSLVLRVDYTFGSRTIERFRPGVNTSISFLF